MYYCTYNVKLQVLDWLVVKIGNIIKIVSQDDMAFIRNFALMVDEPMMAKICRFS